MKQIITVCDTKGQFIIWAVKKYSWPMSHKLISEGEWLANNRMVHYYHQLEWSVDREMHMQGPLKYV